MVTDSSVTLPDESLKTAKDCIRMGPVPGWVESCPFRMDFKAKQAGHVTHLLFDQQINAELRQTYFHVACAWTQCRQCRMSPHGGWNSNRNTSRSPCTRSKRGGVKRSSIMPISPRRAWWIARPPVRRCKTGWLFYSCWKTSGPATFWNGVTLSRAGRCCCWTSARDVHPSGRDAGWEILFFVAFRSFAPDAMEIFRAGMAAGGKRESRGNAMDLDSGQLSGPCSRRTNTPDWHIAHPWIQISDCPDWGMVAAAFAEAWEEDEDDATVAGDRREK